MIWMKLGPPGGRSYWLDGGRALWSDAVCGGFCFEALLHTFRNTGEHSASSGRIERLQPAALQCLSPITPRRSQLVRRKDKFIASLHFSLTTLRLVCFSNGVGTNWKTVEKKKKPKNPWFWKWILDATLDLTNQVVGRGADGVVPDRSLPEKTTAPGEVDWTPSPTLDQETLLFHDGPKTQSPRKWEKLTFRLRQQDEQWPGEAVWIWFGTVPLQ